MTCTKCIEARCGLEQVFPWRERGSPEIKVYSVEMGYLFAKTHEAELLTLREDELRELVGYTEVDYEHVEHMGEFAAQPGLIGTVPSGECLLIDGSHRANYCFKYGKTFSAYLLPHELTNQTIIAWINLSHRAGEQAVGANELGVPVEVDKPESSNE